MNADTLALRTEHSRAILADEHKCDEACPFYHAPGPEDDVEPVDADARVDDLPLTGMRALEVWLASDYECNSAEILVTSDGPDYEDDESPEGGHVVGLGITYSITLTENGLYGDVIKDDWSDPPMTFYQHRGYGDSMDEAADAALKMMAEHTKMLNPPQMLTVQTQGTNTSDASPS